MGLSYPTVISFYTPEAFYRAAARRMLKKCRSLGMPTDFVEVPSCGAHLVNCLQKPKFMLNKLREYEKPIVWLDIDLALFARPPLQLRKGQWDVGLIGQRSSHFPWIAGMIVLKPTIETFRMLRLWHRAAQRHIRSGPVTAGDHSLLIKVLKTQCPNLRVHTYPVTYCACHVPPIPGVHYLGHKSSVAERKRLGGR